MLLPGEIPAGVTYEHPVIAMDMAATVSKLTATDFPEDRKYDGADLSSAAASQDPVHEALYWRKGYNCAIRDSRWKMRWDALRGDTSLYDLSADPVESRNVYSAHPDVAERLTEQYEKWSNEMNKPLWPALIDYYADIDGKRYWFDN